MAQVFIEAGANVNTNDKQGWTPLHFAVYDENQELASILIKGKTNLDTIDK